MNNNAKTHLICNCIATVVALVCVTIAAIFFKKIVVLWFYIVPLFMSITTGESKKNEQKEG